MLCETNYERWTRYKGSHPLLEESWSEENCQKTTIIEEIEKEYFLPLMEDALLERVYKNVLAFVIQDFKKDAKYKLVKHYYKNKESGQTEETGRSFLQMRVGGENGQWETHAILFDKAKWTDAQASEWLDKHKIKFSSRVSDNYEVKTEKKKEGQEEDKKQQDSNKKDSEGSEDVGASESIVGIKQRLTEEFVANAAGANAALLSGKINKIPPEAWIVIALLVRKALAKKAINKTDEEIVADVKLRLPTLVEFAQSFGAKPTKDDIKYGIVLIAKEMGLPKDKIQMLLRESVDESGFPYVLQPNDAFAVLGAIFRVAYETLKTCNVKIISLPPIEAAATVILAGICLYLIPIMAANALGKAWAGVVYVWKNFGWSGRFWKVKMIHPSDMVGISSRENLEFFHPDEDYKLEKDAILFDPYHPDDPKTLFGKETPFTFVGFAAAPRWSSNYVAIVRPKSGAQENQESAMQVTDLLNAKTVAGSPVFPTSGEMNAQFETKQNA